MLNEPTLAATRSADLLAGLEPVGPDPLLALIALANADKRPNKIDVGVGVYRDPQGGTPIPRAVKAPMTVVVCQWPHGTGHTTRSPRGPRAYRRVMAVVAHVSSRNTSRAGSSRGWPARQSARARATAGRSCSAARADFF